jgi:16S rRNA (cytosine967-C5)-methyltransferase
MKRGRKHDHKQSAREIVLTALLQIEEGGAYSNLLLHRLFQEEPTLDPRDRRLITEIVYGTIQYQRRIDFMLAPFVKKGLAQLEPWVRQLLRMSVYQVEFLDRIPEHAIINEAVQLAKRKGHQGIAGLVNGVLRAYLRSAKPNFSVIRDPIERLAVKTSHPTWMVKRWVNQYGLEMTRKICEENNRPPVQTIRVNRLKTERSKVKALLESDGYAVEETVNSDDGLRITSGGNVALLPYFAEGLYSIQDESSMLVAALLDPKPGMTVLDACAAPGGKTAHLAEYMLNEGKIVAVDLHKHKERLIRQNAQRLGITIVETLVQDARTLSETFAPGSFDRILLDAPCSGLGVVRRKPDLKWKKHEADIERIQHIQYKLLEETTQLLKEDGYIVYSTCTLETEENGRLIRRFVADHPHFQLLEETERQILPHEQQSDGFYMVKLCKKNGDHDEYSA